jgi:uncharacterized membrane protein YdjX (TVP38/TMEM64 family)
MANDHLPESPPRFGLLRGLLLLVLVGGVVAFYAGGAADLLNWQSIRSQVDDWKLRVAEQPVTSAAIFFVIYVILTALSVPAAALLSLVAGALFGRVLGVALTCTAATCGASLAFLASRYLFRDWVQRRLGGRLKQLQAGIDREGVWFLLTLRLIPAVPFFLINLGMALTAMRLLPFALVSWLGMLPGSFLYVNAGAELGRIQQPRDVLTGSVLGSLLLLALLPVVMRGLLALWQRSSSKG